MKVFLGIFLIVLSLNATSMVPFNPQIRTVVSGGTTPAGHLEWDTDSGVLVWDTDNSTFVTSVDAIDYPIVWDTDSNVASWDTDSNVVVVSSDF